MKNKILLLGAIGFMAMISAPAFSQNATPTNQTSNSPVPKKIIQPTPVGKSGQQVSKATHQISAATPTTKTPATPSKIIKPTQGGLNKPATKASPAMASTPTSSSAAPVPKHPMIVPKAPQTTTPGKATTGGSSGNNVR